MISSWLDFWNTDNSVYVSKKQHEYYVAKITTDILALPETTEGVTLLDYGSGDATGAHLLADRGLTVVLFDPAPTVTERNKDMLQNDARVHVVSEAELSRYTGTIDLLIVVSVLQYVQEADSVALFRRLHDLLAPSGVLYIADVVSPRTGMLDDIRTLLISAWEGGFVIAALTGLIKTFFSDYRTLRNSLGFTLWDEKAMLSALHTAGLRAERVYPNIGPTSHRMTFRAVKI